MLISSILNICFLAIYQPIIVDSVICSINHDPIEARELVLSEEIIDYAIDNDSYVLTRHYLYKIDPVSLMIIDRISLPQRFNHLLVDPEDVVLITSNEVVTIDRKNLGFKRGIGMENGDYRPLGFLMEGNKSHIYLITDVAEKSIIKVLDLRAGRFLRKLKVDKIHAFDFDRQTKNLTTLDIKNHLIIYDRNLRKNKELKLNFPGAAFCEFQDGYLVANKQGIFRINNQGKLIDFQPLMLARDDFRSLGVILTKYGLVYLDSLTLRIRRFSPNTQDIIRLFPGGSADNPDVAMDRRNNFYFIDDNSLKLEPIAKKEMSVTAFKPPVSKSDSLWYLQVGAFTKLDHALELHARLNSQGLPVFVDSADLYRVKLGGFYDKLTGQQFAEKFNLRGWFLLQEKFGPSGIHEFYGDSTKYLFENGVIRKE